MVDVSGLEGGEGKGVQCYSPGAWLVAVCLEAGSSQALTNLQRATAQAMEQKEKKTSERMCWGGSHVTGRKRITTEVLKEAQTDLKANNSFQMRGWSQEGKE